MVSAGSLSTKSIAAGRGCAGTVRAARYLATGEQQTVRPDRHIAWRASGPPADAELLGALRQVLSAP
ncbi:hypothetical protein [Kitasatospora sp. MAP5-34]|uniref:aromatic-ring hydroxylase C-terminal domain-containing protein n=1 Tax=Kitasatospora sp. MAP5-34 TaxID=3035102 RepID=UPI0024741483|nr:hypothetical protein [Kitasatospora sp. MAP5-34]MDH6577540.1 hypothetical protein [Kitasatospora sp. MAP5-34]